VVKNLEINWFGKSLTPQSLRFVTLNHLKLARSYLIETPHGEKASFNCIALKLSPFFHAPPKL
jgi:hypothetical protein